MVHRLTECMPAPEAGCAALQTLKEQASMIAKAGFTSVWLPPPSDSVSPQGYLPRDLWSLNSAYGSEGELRELLRELKDHELKAVADIVINHRCAHFQVALLRCCMGCKEYSE